MLNVGDIVKFKGGSEFHQSVFWSIEDFESDGRVNIVYNDIRDTRIELCADPSDIILIMRR